MNETLLFLCGTAVGYLIGYRVGYMGALEYIRGEINMVVMEWKLHMEDKS